MTDIEDYEDSPATPRSGIRTPGEPGSPVRPVGGPIIDSLLNGIDLNGLAANGVAVGGAWPAGAEMWGWKADMSEFMPGCAVACGGCGGCPVAISAFPPGPGDNSSGGATGPPNVQSVGGVWVQQMVAPANGCASWGALMPMPASPNGCNGGCGTGCCNNLSSGCGNACMGGCGTGCDNGCGTGGGGGCGNACSGGANGCGNTCGSSTCGFCGGAGCGNCSPVCNGVDGSGNDEELQQFSAQFAQQAEQQDREISVLQERMAFLEKKRAEVQRRWQMERDQLVREISRYKKVLQRYTIPLEEACERAIAPTAVCTSTAGEGSDSGSGAGGGGGETTTVQSAATSWKEAKEQWMDGNGVHTSTLEAKMKKLNGLLSEDPAGRRGSGTFAAGQGADAQLRSPDTESSTTGASSVASTLQSMFPHATVRAQGEMEADVMRSPRASSEEDGGAVISSTPPGANGSRRERRIGSMTTDEVSALADKLEATTKSSIDDRAMRALQGLKVELALEALRKVEDLVRSQGGVCRNLSSILQSVCRKLERRRPPPAGSNQEKRQAQAAEDGQACAPGGDKEASAEQQPSGAGSKTSSGGQAECDGKSSEAKPNVGGRSGDESDSGGSSARASTSSPRREGRRRQRRARRSTAGAGCGACASLGESSDDGAAGDEASEPYWTARRVKRAATGGFTWKERSQGDEERWQLKLLMANLEPAFTDTAMDEYCTWLNDRLASCREEQGPKALQDCCGEVDFSNSGLGNEQVRRLLETLSRNEVHVAVLKLYKNNLSQDGALAIADFLKSNAQAGPVYEMHLSHNEIDDDAAQELMLTLHELKPRYPPLRPAESGTDPAAPRAGGSSDAAGQAVAPSAAAAAPVPVWLRLNQNRVRDSAGVMHTMQALGVTFCSARSAVGCGPGRCARKDCPLLHLYLFSDQAQQQGSRAAPLYSACVAAAADTAAGNAGANLGGGAGGKTRGTKRRGKQSNSGQVGNGITSAGAADAGTAVTA